MKRSGIRRKKGLRRNSASSGFSERVRLAVRIRSRDVCEVDSKVCVERAAHFHHRKLRGHGDHSSVNCLHVCASCHTYLHAVGYTAYLMGWLVHSWDDPAEIPVRRGGGP
jgi:hypothetical protein